MTRAGAGIEAMCALLGALTTAERAPVAGIADASGVARSTAFAIAGRLAAAGLIVRDQSGALGAGETMLRAGFAAHGLAGLHGPAETLLTLLRDETDGTTSLFAGGHEDEAALCYPAPWQATGSPAGTVLTASLVAPDGRAPGEIRLALRPGTRRGDWQAAQERLTTVAAELSRYLRARS